MLTLFLKVCLFISDLEEQISSSCRETLRALSTGNKLLITWTDSKKVLRLILLHFTKRMSPSLHLKRWAVPVFWEINLILQHKGRLVLLTWSSVKLNEDTLFITKTFLVLIFWFSLTSARHLKAWTKDIWLTAVSSNGWSKPLWHLKYPIFVSPTFICFAMEAEANSWNPN